MSMDIELCIQTVCDIILYTKQLELCTTKIVLILFCMEKIKKCYLLTKVIFIFYKNNLENTVSLAHPYIYMIESRPH